jgi:tight adherence protein C
VFAPLGSEDAQSAILDVESVGLLDRWLGLAGYRSPSAPVIFLMAELLALGAGIFIVVGLSLSGVIRTGTTALGELPGGIGDIFLPILLASPWVLGVILLAIPWLAVRATRRERVTQIEQDLSLFLELLATLSEAGLAFDAALDRILSAQPTGRPLAEEFRIFQREVLAGVPRVRALRRVAARADVLSLTILISALVQAEQVGAGVADVLRRQADDLRSRRRERAISLANALPVKLMFPLVICFLPGLFVATLGPTFYQFFLFADSVIRTRGLR